MVYVFKQGDLVYITEKNEGFLENDVLIFSLDWSDIEKTRRLLRPWKILNKEGDWYFYEVLEAMKKYGSDKTLEYDRSLVEIEDKNSAFEFIKHCLGVLSIINRLNYQIQEAEIRYDESYLNCLKYTCDIKNYITYLYGVISTDLLYEFLDLDKEAQDLLRILASALSHEKKLAILKDKLGVVDINTIYKFIPTWCFGSLKIFGFDDIAEKNTRGIPEFKNAARLDGKPNDPKKMTEYLQQLIYSEFKLGEVTKGAELKYRLEKIYKAAQIDRVAKLSDLLEYFQINKARSDYEWYYRIVSRKVLS